MFEYLRFVIADRFGHPILVSLLVTAAIFGLVGAGVQAAIEFGYSEWTMGAAFFGVYAVFAASIGLIGYTIVYLVKYVSVARDRFGPTG